MTATIEGTGSKGLMFSNDLDVCDAIGMGLLNLEDCFDKLRRKIAGYNFECCRLFSEAGYETS
jgi:hypothetical protein